MTDRNSDDDKANITVMAEHRGPLANIRKSPHSRVDKPLRGRVRDADTKFGGELLNEFRHRRIEKPLPLTKQERAKTVAADIAQLLSEFPKAPVKLIIEALAALEPDTDWATSGREIAAIMRQVKSGARSTSGKEYIGIGARSSRPRVHNVTDRRPTDPSTAQHHGVMPPRSTTGTHVKAEEVAPGLFDPSSKYQ